MKIIDNAKFKKRQHSVSHEAQLYRDEFIMKLMIARPFRQRNIREMKLDKNLYRGSDGKWLLKFQGPEMKAGNLVNYHFPGDLVEMLEEYLNIYRPQILNGKECHWVLM